MILKSAIYGMHKSKGNPVLVSVIQITTIKKHMIVNVS